MITIHTVEPTQRTHHLELSLDLTDDQILELYIAFGGTYGFFKEYQELENYLTMAGLRA